MKKFTVKYFIIVSHIQILEYMWSTLA